MKKIDLRTNSQAFPNTAAFRVAFLATALRDHEFHTATARVGFRPGNGMVVLETLGHSDMEFASAGFAQIGEPSYGDADYMDAVQAIPGNRAIVTAETPTFANWGGRRSMVVTILEALAKTETDRLTLACGGKGGQHSWSVRPDGSMIALTSRGWADITAIPKILGGGVLAVRVKGGGVYKLKAAAIANDNYDAWDEVVVQGEGQIIGLDLRFVGSLLTARSADGRLAVLECINIEDGQIRIVDRTSDAVKARPRGRVTVNDRRFGLFSVQVEGKQRTIIGPMNDHGLPHHSIAAYAS